MQTGTAVGSSVCGPSDHFRRESDDARRRASPAALASASASASVSGVGTVPCGTPFFPGAAAAATEEREREEGRGGEAGKVAAVFGGSFNIFAAASWAQPMLALQYQTEPLLISRQFGTRYYNKKILLARLLSTKICLL